MVQSSLLSGMVSKITLSANRYVVIMVAMAFNFINKDMTMFYKKSLLHKIVNAVYEVQINHQEHLIRRVGRFVYY